MGSHEFTPNFRWFISSAHWFPNFLRVRKPNAGCANLMRDSRQYLDECMDGIESRGWVGSLRLTVELSG